MKLTRFQRNSIFAGNAPALTGVGKPPVRKGDTVRLSSRVQLTVLRVDTTRSVRGEQWSLHYRIDDRRDPTRLIRRTPPVAHYGKANFDEHGFPLRIPEGEASEESSYTPAGKSAVPDCGEAVASNVQDGFTEQAKLEGHQAHAARRLKYEKQSVLSRLAYQLDEAQRLGISPLRDLARIEAGVAKLERTVAQAKQQRRAA